MDFCTKKRQFLIKSLEFSFKVNLYKEKGVLMMNALRNSAQEIVKAEVIFA